MRVLFVTHNFPRFAGDAAGSFLLRLATALGEVGVSVRVVAPSAAGLAGRDRVGDIEVRRFRYAPRRLETLAYTGNMAADVQRSWSARAALAGMLAAAARAARAEARAWDAALVHAHWWFPAGLAMTLPGAPRRLPLVVTSHGSDVRLARTTGAARPLLRRVVRHASAYTFVSRWLRDEACAMTPLADPVVAPMPIATSMFAPPAPTAVRDGVLFVGRLNAQKGVAELLEALARQRTPARATIVGDGPDAAVLREQAAALGLGERITWLPGVSQLQLAELYGAAQVLAVPSRDEGLGLVAAEAMLCETPVVAFDSGGLPDVVTPDATGILVPLGDVAGFARALDSVMEDRGHAAALGTRGRVDALARFGPSAVAARYRAVYDAALARHAAHRGTRADR